MPVNNCLMSFVCSIITTKNVKYKKHILTVRIKILCLDTGLLAVESAMDKDITDLSNTSGLQHEPISTIFLIITVQRRHESSSMSSQSNRIKGFAPVSLHNACHTELLKTITHNDITLNLHWRRAANAMGSSTLLNCVNTQPAVGQSGQCTQPISSRSAHHNNNAIITAA